VFIFWHQEIPPLFLTANEAPVTVDAGVTVAVLSAITTFLNPTGEKGAHLAAAHSFDKLNNDSRLFWSIECWQEDSDEVLTSKLRDLVERKNKLNGTSPQIPNWAYKRAKAGIAAGEADFKVDKVGTASLPPPDAA
jgi:hypothetical protein